MLMAALLPMAAVPPAVPATTSAPPPSGPVFVLGSPRSGNTLLACLLNKHPDLFVLFETNLYNTLRQRWQRRVRRGAEPAHAFVEAVMHALGRTWSPETSDVVVRREDVEAAAAAGSPHYGRMMGAYVETLMRATKPTARRWGDKTPHHMARVDAILAAHPDAQFVHVYRDPRDVVASLTKPTFPHASENALTNAEVVLQYLDLFERSRARIPAGQLLDVRYEALVEDPEASLHAVCAFLGVAFDPAMLEPASVAVRRTVGQPTYKGWERIRPQQASLPAGLAPLVAARLDRAIGRYGYPRVAARPGALVRAAAAIRTAPFRVLRAALGVAFRLKYPGSGPFLMRDENVLWRHVGLPGLTKPNVVPLDPEPEAS